MYLAIVLDVFTRAVRGWSLSLSLDQELTLAALRMALAERVPGIHHSDQGVQYAAYAYIELLKEQNIQISSSFMGPPQARLPSSPPPWPSEAGQLSWKRAESLVE